MDIYCMYTVWGIVEQCDCNTGLEGQLSKNDEELWGKSLRRVVIANECSG